MIVRYTPSALAHLAEVRAYIALERPATAREIGQRIREAVTRLADFPHTGRTGRVEGTRELVIPRLPYIVVYLVSAEHVDVLAILHGARRWPSSFDAQ